MSRRKGKRSRFRNAADTQDQLESIEKEQAGFRRRQKGERIAQIEKSKQRWKNANRNLLRREDFEAEYD
jgi:hypothetical protein